MSLAPSWILALAIACLAAGAGLAWLWLTPLRAPHPLPLPTAWPLSPRPVFSADERRVHRHLREALPHHLVLAKLPLVRLCQPDDRREARYWYTLLSRVHVGFAVCSPNGRVLAALDLIDRRPPSPRRLQIKQSVLDACRVPYLRCTVDAVPSAAELQLLVPQTGVMPRGPLPAPPAALASQPLWHDSTVLQDSFFASDRGLGDGSGFGELGSQHGGLWVRELHEPPRPAPTRPPHPSREAGGRRPPPLPARP